jgi:hypothetical protein
MFLNPQDEAGPSISPSVVLGSFVLSVYIEALDISISSENKEDIMIYSGVPAI